MTDEIIFVVEGASAKPAESITLASAELRERDHLQEWVVANPAVLGEGTRIVDVEFGRWTDHAGAVERDRLDVLALDPDGRLVVVELKRDRAPDTVEMQALKYAALVSRFTLDRLSKVHAGYLSGVRDTQVTEEEALAELEECATITEESLRLPRVVLMASSFPKAVTATVVFLHQELGLDVRLLKFQAYQTAHEVLVSVSQHYPPPGIEEYVLTPEAVQARERRSEAVTRRREASTVSRLLASGAIEPGEPFKLMPPSEDVRSDLERYFSENPDHRTATWQNHPSGPLIWEADGEQYTPTGLAKQILERAVGSTGSLQGPKYWVNFEGKSLVELAAELSTVPIENHLRKLTDELRPVYQALDDAIRTSFDGVVVTSQTRAIRYDVDDKKLVDLLIHRDHLSLYIRGLPPDTPDPMGLMVSEGRNPAHVQLRLAAHVGPALELLNAQRAGRAVSRSDE